jgi:type I restriction enzyme S subunit
MNSISSSGWLNLSDLKYANLSKKDAENTTLQNGDLLFNRTNSKELVGKCAIWRDTKGVFSFASYLIRLRLKEGMLPEYLWATLNSTYGKYRLMNAAKQAVSMSNVSPTDLGRITAPLPPLPLQEKFALLVRQIEVLREEMLGKLELFHELQSVITGQALLGDITSSWREQHSEEIMNAANARNDALRARGTKIHTSVVEIPLPEIGIAHSSDHIRTARRWLIEELSEFQSFVFDAIDEWPGTLLADNDSELDRFCQQWPIEHERNMHDRAKRALEQLAALGLIAKVALPNDNGDFITGYRQLRPEEKSRLNDIAVLQASLESISHDAGTAS